MLDEHIKTHQIDFSTIDIEVNRYYSDDSVMGVHGYKEYVEYWNEKLDHV